MYWLESVFWRIGIGVALRRLNVEPCVMVALLVDIERAVSHRVSGPLVVMLRSHVLEA